MYLCVCVYECLCAATRHLVLHIFFYTPAVIIGQSVKRGEDANVVRFKRRDARSSSAASRDDNARADDVHMVDSVRLRWRDLRAREVGRDT